jgi:hypothetical protein
MPHRTGNGPNAAASTKTPTANHAAGDGRPKNRYGGVRHPFAALRHFTLDGTDHADHNEQGSMIRRCIIRRNRHVDDRRLRSVVDRANVA